LRLGVEVWGAFADGSLAVSPAGSQGAELLLPERIVLATGAYERPQPFPGWTEAGVLSAGGAQLLLKESRAVPQGRVVVAGTGPFVVAVAAQLVEAGAELAAVVE